MGNSGVLNFKFKSFSLCLLYVYTVIFQTATLDLNFIHWPFDGYGESDIIH